MNTYTQTQVIAPQSACSALTWLLPLGCIAGDMEKPHQVLAYASISNIDAGGKQEPLAVGFLMRIN